MPQVGQLFSQKYSSRGIERESLMGVFNITIVKVLFNACKSKDTARGGAAYALAVIPAMHPIAAAVIACLKTLSEQSPATNTFSALVFTGEPFLGIM